MYLIDGILNTRFRKSSLQITAVQIQQRANYRIRRSQYKNTTKPHKAGINTPFKTLVATNWHKIEIWRIAYTSIQCRAFHLLVCTQLPNKTLRRAFHLPHLSLLRSSSSHFTCYHQSQSFLQHLLLVKSITLVLDC